MTGKDAGPISRGRLYSVWGLAIVVFAGASLWLVSRSLFGPSTAQAQAPQRQRATTGPAARTTAPSTTQPAQRARTAGPAAPTAEQQTRKLKVVAVVNGEQITRQQLAQESLRRYGREVLETFINKQVIWQACQQKGITITQQHVEDEIARSAEKFGLTAQRWLEMLEQERDIKPDKYRREIVWPTLALRALAADKLTVSQQEVDQAMETEYGPKVKARIIVLGTKQEADQVYTQAIAAPDQFDELAKEHSRDPHSASVGGMIPPIRMHTGDPQFERVAFSLNSGQIGPPIAVGNQYVIVKCEKRLPSTPLTPRFKATAIEQLKDRLTDDKLRASAAELFKTLQTQSQVVNVYNSPELQQRLPGVAATINGQQVTIAQLSEECIQRHGEEVLDGEVNRRLLMQELKRRGKNVASEEIDAEIARAADTYGYLKSDGTPDVDAWLKEITSHDGATVELYVRDAVWPTVALKQLVTSDPTTRVTDDDLRKGWEANYGERVEVLAVVLSNQRTATKVWDMARNRLTEDFFGQLAEQYSVEPVSRSNAGKVPPIRRHSGQPKVEEEAFSLKAGQLSGIVAVGDKFIVMYCQGRTKPVVQEFESVKDELYKDIEEKKFRLAMTKEFDRLKEVAQIDNFLAGTTQAGKSAKPAISFTPQSKPHGVNPLPQGSSATRPSSGRSR